MNADKSLARIALHLRVPLKPKLETVSCGWMLAQTILPARAEEARQLAAKLRAIADHIEGLFNV